MPTDYIMIDIIARNTVYGILQKMQKKKKIKRKQEKRLETSELEKRRLTEDTKKRLY